MKIGISGNIGEFTSKVPQLAKFIEDAGFESLWAGEHIIVPKHIANPVRHGTMLPESYKHMPDMFITLASAAATTSRLKLGTSICLVPQRNPLILAKEVATLDQFSEGRLLFGIGHGWIEEEAGIMGVPFDKKVKMTNECIKALRTIWAEDEPEFHGEFISFPAVFSNPKPKQRPHPPIIIGSGDGQIDNSRIIRRVAEMADGWMPLGLTPAQAKAQVGELRLLCEECGRDFGNMEVTIINGAQILDPKHAAMPADELIAEYEAAGVSRLIFAMGRTDSESVFKQQVEAVARSTGITRG